MANRLEAGSHLVRITTDDREHQLWVAAAQEKAIQLVPDAVPDGWTAALLSNKLKPAEIEVLNLKPGEVRELTLQRPGLTAKAELRTSRHLLAVN
jgi:hypothetical protein